MNPSLSSRVLPVSEATRVPGHLWGGRLITLAILLTPIAALVVILSGVIVDGFSWLNMALAIAFYVIIAHGVTVGFHRLFTHKSFEAKRPLKISLAVLGSMSLQGSMIGWVADHRRHHRFVEQDGDPHSPARPPTERFGRLRGLYHAHMGWFFRGGVTPREKFAPDLLADRDLVLIDRLFVPLSVLTFVLPFAIGYAVTGRFSGGLAAVPVGGPRPGGAVPPRHVEHELVVPLGRDASLPYRRREHELRADGGAVDGRVVAQRAPRRSRRSLDTASTAASSTRRPRSSGSSSASGGRPRCAGRIPLASPRAESPDSGLRRRERAPARSCRSVRHATNWA